MVDPDPSYIVSKREWGVVLLLLREKFPPGPIEVSLRSELPPLLGPIDWLTPGLR